LSILGNHQKKTVTTKNLTDLRAAEGKSDDFNKLMFRFLEANERLKLAAHALAVEEVTEALEQLRGDFEHWERDHSHAPEAKEGHHERRG
jgi:hypothetical protein